MTVTGSFEKVNFLHRSLIFIDDTRDYPMICLLSFFNQMTTTMDGKTVLSQKRTVDDDPVAATTAGNIAAVTTVATVAAGAEDETMSYQASIKNLPEVRHQIQRLQHLPGQRIISKSQVPSWKRTVMECGFCASHAAGFWVMP